eukprot:m.99423 g.99423  ORF g.99423 m.99423 type:complete len:54 (+) comp15334_c2_seq2:522-683(+)
MRKPLCLVCKAKSQRSVCVTFVLHKVSHHNKTKNILSTPAVTASLFDSPWCPF